MGLKAFHLFFIVASLLLSGFVGFWGIREYLDSREILYAVLGVVGALGAIGLGLYLPRFLKKTKGIGYFAFTTALWLASAPEASACPVCIGDPNHPMTVSANAGVTFLLGVVVVVLVLFGGLFLFWRKRERVWQAGKVPTSF